MRVGTPGPWRSKAARIGSISTEGTSATPKQLGFHGRSDLRIGFSVYSTYAAFDDVRVRKYASTEPRAAVGSIAEPLSSEKGRTRPKLTTP